MKAILIVFGQALNDEIIDIINKNHIRVYTQWDETPGRGSF